LPGERWLDASEDLLQLAEEEDYFPAKALVKRHVCIRNRDFPLMTDKEFQGRLGFSTNCNRIKKGKYSGTGDDAMWFVGLYYEPSSQYEIEEAFEGLGMDISEYEQVPVDADSPDEADQTMLFHHSTGQCTRLTNTGEREVKEDAREQLPRSPLTTLQTAVSHWPVIMPTQRATVRARPSHQP